MARTLRRDRVVWSSEPQLAAKQQKSPNQVALDQHYPPPNKQTARLWRSRVGRAGKTVVLIEGLLLPPQGYQTLARELRRALGVGGTVKGQVIEIQGDMRERVADLLTERGYRIKLAGG